MATGVTYLEMADAIKDYYGAGSDVWTKFVTGGLQGEELVNVVKQVPGASVTISNSGRVLGYEYANPFPAAQTSTSLINSNVSVPTYGNTSFNAAVNGNYSYDVATQTGSFSSGATKVSTGTKVSTVVGKVGTAIAAVSAGMFLGAKIDSALYNAGKFFDLNPPESLNPETWDDMASTELGKSVIKFLFDIGEDGSTTAYMSEDMIAYMYNYWDSLGLWDVAAASRATYSGSTAQFPQPSVTAVDVDDIIIVNQDYGQGSLDVQTIYGDAGVHFYLVKEGNNVHIYPFTETSGEQVWYTVNGGRPRLLRTLSSQENTFNGNPYYTGSEIVYTENNVTTVVTTNSNTLYPTTVALMRQIATIICDGTIQPSGGGIPGTDPEDPSATEHLDPSQIDPSQPILPQLQQQLPNTFSNPIKEKVPQSDGTNREITYYPVPWPRIGNDTEQPVSGTPTQPNPTVNPTNPTDETNPIRDIITNPNPQPETPTPGDPATPPDTGTGSTPPVVPPTGQASSMWTVYNPTQAQLDAFGSWLWSSNFVDQIKKLFNDPMQAIIGVHKVYVTPSTGGQVNIKCGYIDSGCPAAEVTSQYTTIDCGTVNVREYYGNVFDYAPFTEISLYLPFIGIVKLDVADVMRSSVSVKYHVDVITGACLADVKVSRDGENAVLYQYAGSAIVSYPISSGSYASAVTGVLSLAAGVAGTVVTGGAAAPALIGGALGLTHLHTNVEHSGGFAGSPGAMGGKKPYLIISRAQENLPNNFEHYEGKPASKTVKLGDCSGFTKVKSINIKGVPATSGELEEIVSLLKSGVIV